MLLLSVLICFYTLLQASSSTPILASKPRPVDIAYICTTITDAKQQGSKQDDVPVIMIHGMTLNKETWHGIFEIIAFETKKKVCVVDLRNHGQSPWNDKEYDVVAMTEDIRHFMDRIKAPKAIVLGHSLGGKVAVHLALNYPERVEKVIVEDMRPNGNPPAALEGSKYYARLLMELAASIPQGVSEREAKQKFLQLMKESFAKANETFEVALEDLAFVPIKCLGGKCQLSINPVLLDAIVRNPAELKNESSGLFKGPALFIYGSESANKVGEDESNIKKLFPNAELVAVEEVGHNVHSSRKFLTEVIKFINSKRE